MAISLKHRFVSAKSDGSDSSLVRPSNWNDEHDLLMADGRLLGRVSAGTGAAEELTAAQVRALLGLYAPVVVTLASDFASTSTSMANVAGMAIAAGADEVWEVRVFGKYQTVATTTGAGMTLTVPSGAYIAGQVNIRQGAPGTASMFEAELVTSGQNWTSASVVAANTDYAVWLSAMVATASTSGNIQLQWRSEVSGSAATLRAGSRLIGRRLA